MRPTDADVMVIDQPLSIIGEVTFDEVPFYGKDRIAALLDQAQELGVPENVVNEAKTLTNSVRWRSAGPRHGEQWDWGPNPDETLAAHQQEINEEYKNDKRHLRDFFKENFLSAEALSGTHRFTVSVPIFVIGSPKAKKSKVSMRCSTQTKDAAGFELKLFGNGLGADKICKVTLAEEHVCAGGEGRRADLEVPFLAVPCGFKLSTGPKVLWWNWVKDDSQHGRLRISDCKPRELKSLAGQQNGDDLHLKDTAAVTKFNTKIDWLTQFNYTVGVAKGKDVSAKIKVSISRAQNIELEVELPGRRTYRPHLPKEGFGGIWRIVDS
jgi:hypothetical protein